MSGFVPKRVLNARISTTIEKNQTPMQAGLAPRVGKSGASIRLYYQRVDGCECICDPFNDPVVIQKRYLLPGNLEEETMFYNSAGVRVTSFDPALAVPWALGSLANASNYNTDGDQTDRIYYAIVLSRDVNPVVGNIKPVHDLKLGYRRFRDDLGNTVFPGGPGANYGIPGTTDGQFSYVGPPNTGVNGTVFKPITYGGVGAMRFGINEIQVIPKEDYTIVGPSSATPWDVGPFKGSFLETDRAIFSTGINSGWRIDLSGVKLDNPTNQPPRFSGPGKSHWGPVNDPTVPPFFGTKHNPNHVSADNVFIVHNPVHFGGYALLFNISQAILESVDIRAQTTGSIPASGTTNPFVGNILNSNAGPGAAGYPVWAAGLANDYSARYPGQSGDVGAGFVPGKGTGPLQFWSGWGELNGGLNVTNNDPWMALHWFVYHNGISTFYDPKGSFKLQTSNNITDNCVKYDDIPDEPGDFLPNAGVSGFRLRAIAPDKDPPNLEWWYQQNINP